MDWTLIVLAVVTVLLSSTKAWSLLCCSPFEYVKTVNFSFF